MATGPKKGLTPARSVGSSADNLGFETYEIASAYGTQISTGDPVKLVSGKVQKAANGDTVLGVFIGCSYVDSNGVRQQKPYFPASYAAPAGTTIEAKVVTNPFKTYQAVADAAVTSVVPGQIYPATLTAGSTATGVSNAVVNVSGGVVLAAAGMVKVQRVLDTANRVLEVTLVNQLNRDNG